MQDVLADMAVSISELKKNPSAVLKGAKGGVVAILNHHRVVGYMVPADVYGALVERLDDLELMQIMSSRAHETPISLRLDDL
ncbi:MULTISPECIES: type II toxin-antitoxin system Phd/YefM family antitoxin [Pseudomonas]|uniref:Antitoxin n=1 Tax=Pseudomonas retamae TaxID=702110 RepID=A0ABW7DAD6_9PSED